MNRREAGFAAGILAGTALLLPYGLVLTALATAGFALTAIVDELARLRARSVALVEVAAFRALIRERHMDILAAYLVVGRRSLMQGAIHRPRQARPV